MGIPQGRWMVDKGGIPNKNMDDDCRGQGRAPHRESCAPLKHLVNGGEICWILWGMEHDSTKL